MPDYYYKAIIQKTSEFEIFPCIQVIYIFVYVHIGVKFGNLTNLAFSTFQPMAISHNHFLALLTRQNFLLC